MKVALLGSGKMVLGCMLGGIHEGLICETREEAEAGLQAFLSRTDIGIILVSSEVAMMIPQALHALRTSPRMIPVISVIPDTLKKTPPCEGVAMGTIDRGDTD